jgi:hypothetical protein
MIRPDGFQIPPYRQAVYVGRNFKTLKVQALFILAFLTFSFCYGQKLNQTYCGVSSDSLYSGHQLVFTTDTTLEISTLPRHMSKQFNATFNYKRTGNKIDISTNNILPVDSIALSNHGMTQFLKSFTLVKDKRALVDNSAKMVYVLYKDFSIKYYLTYIIDGKSYKQETGLSNAYGLIKTRPKENKALKDKLASLNLDNYTANVYLGLEAYEKFGYDNIFGVIVLKQKE